MKYDRALLEKAVRTYKKIKNRNFILASELSEKQIANAIKHIDKFIKPEDVVAFLDNTIFMSGKGGILLTTEKIESSDGINNGAYFEKFIKAECSGDEVRVFYDENGYRKIKIKTYAEEATSLLNTIVKLRDEAEKTAPEKEIAPKAEPPKQAPIPKSAPKEKAGPAVKLDMDEILKALGMDKPENAKAEEPVPAPKPAPKTEEIKEVPTEKGEDASCFKKALSGDVQAMLDMANICAKEGDENYSEEKLQEAFFWYLRAAESGDAIGAKKAGMFLEEGIGIPVNREKALEFYGKTLFAKADHDFLKANIESGETEAVPDEEEYEDFVEWAGDFGEILYESGLDFDERFRGYSLIYISAMLGYGDAEFMLGKIYSKDSEMGKEDFRKGCYWIDRACQHGCDAAETYVWESWKRDS